MELKINSYTYGERPQVSIPSPDFYKVLGEQGIRTLVSRHYDLLRTSPIKSLFHQGEKGFEMAKKNSADFMIQICGGPDYFNQNRGAPKLILRHAPFSIDKDARIVWLNCYKTALLELQISEELIVSFWNYINIFSSWMVNTPSETKDSM